MNFKKGAKVFLHAVKNPHLYGVASLNKKNKVTKLIEKLNTVDKKYLGPEIVEELKNFGQSGGRRRSRSSRRSHSSLSRTHCIN